MFPAFGLRCRLHHQHHHDKPQHAKWHLRLHCCLQRPFPRLLKETTIIISSKTRNPEPNPESRPLVEDTGETMKPRPAAQPFRHPRVSQALHPRLVLSLGRTVLPFPMLRTLCLCFWVLGFDRNSKHCDYTTLFSAPQLPTSQP